MVARCRLRHDATSRSLALAAGRASPETAVRPAAARRAFVERPALPAVARRVARPTQVARRAVATAPVLAQAAPAAASAGRPAGGAGSGNRSLRRSTQRRRRGLRRGYPALVPRSGTPASADPSCTAAAARSRTTTKAWRLARTPVRATCPTTPLASCRRTASSLLPVVAEFATALGSPRTTSLRTTSSTAWAWRVGAVRCRCPAPGTAR